VIVVGLLLFINAMRWVVGVHWDSVHTPVVLAWALTLLPLIVLLRCVLKGVASAARRDHHQAVPGEDPDSEKADKKAAKKKKKKKDKASGEQPPGGSVGGATGE